METMRKQNLKRWEQRPPVLHTPACPSRESLPINGECLKATADLIV